MTMIWVDWVILSIIGISALISLLRGFVREALSLAGWIGAFLIAKSFYEDLAALLVEQIPTNSIRLTISWAALFVLTLVVAGTLNYLAGRLIDKAGMSGTDRLLGMVFGGLRGILVAALIILGLKQFTPVQEDSWWGESQLIPHVEMISDWFFNHFKEDLPDVKGLPKLPETPELNKLPENQ